MRKTMERRRERKVGLIGMAIAIVASNLTASTAGDPTPIPYRIGARQLSVTRTPDLLPEKLDAFQRGKVETISETEVQAEYGDGSKKLMVFASVDDSPKVAQDGVRQCLENGPGPSGGVTYIRRHEVHFYQFGQVVCWSEGGYFFSVEPTNGLVGNEEYERVVADLAD